MCAFLTLEPERGSGFRSGWVELHVCHALRVKPDGVIGVSFRSIRVFRDGRIGSRTGWQTLADVHHGSRRRVGAAVSPRSASPPRLHARPRDSTVTVVANTGDDITWSACGPSRRRHARRHARRRRPRGPGLGRADGSHRVQGELAAYGAVPQWFASATSTSAPTSGARSGWAGGLGERGDTPAAPGGGRRSDGSSWCR